jgi:hypothetical protein
MVPFHDLWRNGGESEKRPPCPLNVMNLIILWKVSLRHDTRGMEGINGKKRGYDGRDGEEMV